MGAGTKQETITADRVAVLAAAVTGIGASRVKQGYARWTDAQNFESLVQALTDETQGYFSFWIRRATRQESGQERQPTFQIVGELVVAVDKDNSSDLNSAWDFALGLAESLMDADNYTGSQALPMECPFSLYEVRVVEDRGICVFDFGAYGNGGLTFFN